MIRALLFLWLAWQTTVSPEALQHLQAGTEALKQRRFDVAIAEFRKVTELDPTQAAGFANLGEAYMENQALQTGCDTKTTLLYEYQHNPFTSFADILNNAARCSNMVLANPSGCSVTDCALIDDLNSGSAPNFMWLTPNDCNNMHGAANNSTSNLNFGFVAANFSV